MVSPKNKGTKLFFSQYGGEQPIPPEFIAAMNRVEEIQPVPNDVGAETLSDTIVESKVETNRTNERVRRTVKKDAGNIGPLHFIHVNDQGQPIQVSRTMMPTAYAVANPSAPTATSTPADQDLGNGWTIREVGVIGTYVAGVFTPGIFTENEWTNKSPSYPPEYVTAENTTIADSVGTASAPTASTGGSKTEQQKTEFVKRVSTTVPSTNSTVTEAETNQYKQKVTIVRTHTATVGSPSATVDVEQRAIPGGRTEAITKTVSGVFDATVFAKQRQDAVPERFKKATPEITEKHVATGTASAPSLSSGDVAKSEQQKDSFVKETSVTNKAVGGYPTLSGQTYDQSLDIVIPFTETIVADGTGGARADVTPLGTDIYGSAVALKKQIDATALIAALNAFLVEFPGSASLRLPDTLETIESVFESSQGDGTFEETGDFTGVNPGFSISLRGSGQGSGSLMPSLKIDIQENRADHIPTTHHLFYLPSPVTVAEVLSGSGATQTWPKFRPRAHTFLCIGRRVSVHAEASTQFHVTDTDTISTIGTGKSREVALIINEVRIPPTIHDSVSVDGDTSDDVSAISADASVDTGLSNASSGISDFVNASINPTSVTSTPGDSAIPTSGICLLDCHCEPAGMLNYVRVHAETFDWGDVSP